MAVGRRFEKSRNRHISTVVRPVGTTFHIMSHTNALKPVDRQNFCFIFVLKIQDGRWPHFEKSEIRQFIARSVLSESCFALLVDHMNALMQVMWYFPSASIK